MRFMQYCILLLMATTFLPSTSVGICLSGLQQNQIKADALGDALPQNALLRMGTLRFQHPGPPVMLAVSADQTKVFSMDQSWLIGWEITTGRQLWKRKLTFAGSFQLTATGYGIHPFAIIPESGKLVTSSSNGRIKFWNPENGRARTIKSPASSTWKAVDVSPDSNLIALGGASRLWVCNSEGEQVYEIQNKTLNRRRRDDPLATGDYCYPRFSADSKILAVTKSDDPKSIALLDAKTGELLRKIVTSDRVVRMDFSPDGSGLVTTERNCTATRYDINTGEALWSWKVANVEGKNSCFSAEIDLRPDGRQVAVGFINQQEKGIQLLDAQTGAEMGKLCSPNLDPWLLQYTNDNQLVGASEDAFLQFWDVETKNAVSIHQGVRASSLCAISRNDKHLAFIDDATSIHLVDIKDGKIAKSFDEKDASSFEQLMFSDDGSKIAIGFSSNEHLHLSVWDLATSQRTHHWQWEKKNNPSATITSLDFSTEGNRISVATFLQDSVKVFDLDNNKRIATIERKRVKGAALNENGDRIFTSGWDASVEIWDCDSSKQVQKTVVSDERQRQKNSFGVRLSHNQQKLASCNLSSCIRLFDQELNEIALIDGAGEFTSDTIEFSNNDLWIGAGTKMGLSVFDVATGDRVLFFNEHSNTIDSIGFGAKDQTLLSGGKDGVCYLWDITTNTDKVSGNNDQFGVLIGNDGVRAFKMFQHLAATPETTFDLLYEQLMLQSTDELPKAAKWIAAIGSTDRRLARNAKKKIYTLGPAAYPQLIDSLKSDNSSKTKRRLVKEAAYLIHHRYRRATILLAELDSPDVDKAFEDLIEASRSEHWTSMLQEAQSHRARFLESRKNGNR